MLFASWTWAQGTIGIEKSKYWVKWCRKFVDELGEWVLGILSLGLLEFSYVKVEDADVSWPKYWEKGVQASYMVMLCN